MWKNASWILHHDNTPARNVLSVKRYLAKNNIPVMEHPSYSPDLAPCDNDCLRKIRPLPEMLRTSFRKTYMPEQNISEDESLMLFKGRLLIKQYILLKRARFGIKIFFVCESKSGHACDFFIYTAQEKKARVEKVILRNLLAMRQ